MYLTQSLHRSLQQHPERVATVFAGRRRTFAEQAARVARLAGGLRGVGVQSGDRVGVLGLNSDRYLESYLAVPWADAVVVPVNTRWAPAEIAFSLRDSGTRVLIVDDTFAPLVPELRELTPELGTVVHAGDGPSGADSASFEELAAGGAAIPDARRGDEELAGIFYTGGTTGFPKGVMLSHRNLMIAALRNRAVTPGGCFLHVAPMFHLADYHCTVSVCSSGGTHVIVPSVDPVGVLTAIAENSITDLGLIPVILQMIVDNPALAEHDVSSVRSVAYGGSSITVSVLERAKKAFPAAGFTQVFGQTEAAPVLTRLGPEEHDDTNRPDLLRSAGRAMEHCEVLVVDPSGAECPRGVQGEIVARGGNVMLGYWNRPEETAAALRDGWLHTGDAGVMDADGYLFVLDRIKDMIVTGGENVFSAEVENAIASHPAVAACAVIGLPDETWGERVHAVVVLHPGQHAEAEEITGHARGFIGGYKIPRSVEFVDRLPVSAAGKVLKRELREARRST
ncbi:MAG TPA: long-chain-fatty-acid--CoA ligase [Sporichthyaceae bacterium]|jgi:acyl-CoA synthetase (AMP-forming)/AMP-acid ligase II|nr:long-chain-fatty-acid--CoA ligase [Sporichthyaceae bacterium]